jgi:hypothetical protein
MKHKPLEGSLHLIQMLQLKMKWQALVTFCSSIMYSEQICSGAVNNSQTYIKLWKFTLPINNIKPNFKYKPTDARNIACLSLKRANYEPNVTISSYNSTANF